MASFISVLAVLTLAVIEQSVELLKKNDGSSCNVWRPPTKQNTLQLF